MHVTKHFEFSIKRHQTIYRFKRDRKRLKWLKNGQILDFYNFFSKIYTILDHSPVFRALRLETSPR